MMQQWLIEGRGPDLSQATPQQLANISLCIQQLARDPRAKAVYGTTGHSTGCCVIAEVASKEEVQRIVGFMQISGLSQCEVTPLVNASQFRAGLQEAQKAVGTKQEFVTEQQLSALYGLTPQ
ncbi:MAG: hypothetical protein HY681_01860 [Chloroflexi bacterium]|nr:hypothetical protein [Chloroflexota bacterium]